MMTGAAIFLQQCDSALRKSSGAILVPELFCALSQPLQGIDGEQPGHAVNQLGKFVSKFSIANRSQLGFFPAVQHSYEEIDRILRPLAPVLAREADAILDLRELLMSQGHPGKCVRCFFRLFEAAGGKMQPQLAPLRAWLETHLEIAVRSGTEDLETLPFTLGKDDDLESFCLRSIEQIRLDRGYQSSRLQLAFRYKALAA